MDQITPIIRDKENIPPDAHGNHIHGSIGTSTTPGSALSMSRSNNHLGNDAFM
jgi:hypothetical protein